MKYFIASDIHGSAYYCRRLLEAYEREGADRLVLLGDILYHGPRNDLPKDYNPKDVFAMLNERRMPSSASAATATAKSIRWSWNFPSWRRMPS